MARGRRPFDPPPDPAPEYTEWIQHRYDPGYYLGGRIPPYLRRKRSGNRYGYVLVVSAVITGVAGVDVLADVRDPAIRFLEALLLAGVILLEVAGGRRLLRRLDDTHRK